MNGVLKTSRVRISLVPERLIAEAASEQGIDPEMLVTSHNQDEVVLGNAELARPVFDRAVGRWWPSIPAWARLNFRMQRQLQSQWCWAATSVSIALHYMAGSGWTQCLMVNQELGQRTCCQNGATPRCNQPNVLDSPLRRAGVLAGVKPGPVGYDVIGANIDAERPIACRIAWRGGGGHFVVIEGYQRHGGEWVAVDDPWDGPHDLPVSTLLRGSYGGTGMWTDTYLTDRRPFLTVHPVKEFRLPLEIWERIGQQPVATGRGDTS